MKLHTALLLSAIVAAASFASATDCTTEQTAVIDSQNPTAFGEACPALFSNTTNVLSPSSTTTKEMLQEIEGCKAATCTTFLTQITDKTPDCEIEGVNAKGKYNTVLKLCTKFAAGPVSDEDLEKSFEDLIKFGGYELIESSGAGEEEAVGNGTVPTTVPSSAPSNSTAEKSTTPAPGTAGSNAASYFTGVATIAAAAVVSSLMV